LWPRLREWLGFFGPALMLAMLPMLANFISNRYQVSVTDLLVPALVALGIALIVTAVLWPLWRRNRLAGYVAATFATLVLSENFEGRTALFSPVFEILQPFKGLSATPVVSVATAAFVLAIAWWLGRAAARFAEARKWKVKDVAGGIFIAIATTFGFMSLNVAKDLALEWPQFFHQPPAIELPASAKDKPKPDIYYIVLDRFASDTVLQEQFGYDNSDFSNYLRDLGYHINPSSHSNYPYTTMSVAGTVQGNYLNDIVDKYGSASQQTIVPFNESVRKSPVAAALKDIGYEYTLIGNWYESSNKSPIADEEVVQAGKLTILGLTATLDNFSKNNLIASPFGRIITTRIAIGDFKVLWYDNLGDVDQTKLQLATLREMADEPAGGRFIFAHLLTPHEPYDFNADGSINPNNSSDNIGRPVKEKYLNQVRHITNEMKKILKQIDERSGGQAVVVLQADEGPYPFALNDEVYDGTLVNNELLTGDMRKWSDSALRMKMGNQAAYHIPAADWATDAGAADAVNVFRLVFNRYFDTSLPYLPDCHYVYPNGRDKPFAFASVTERLTGEPEDERCSPNGTARP
jgi:hypothetical protein